MLVNLSNDIYCTIPHNFGVTKAPTIDHLLRVKEKTRMIEHILHVVELQQIFIRSLKFELRQKNPFDVFYSELCVSLQKLDFGNNVFQVINEGVNKTQSEIHTNQFDFQMQNMYEIYKPTEKLRFKSFETKMHNKFLMW
jgi:hypothetical protein